MLFLANEETISKDINHFINIFLNREESIQFLKMQGDMKKYINLDAISGGHLQRFHSFKTELDNIKGSSNFKKSLFSLAAKNLREVKYSFFKDPVYDQLENLNIEVLEFNKNYFENFIFELLYILFNILPERTLHWVYGQDYDTPVIYDLGSRGKVDVSNERDFIMFYCVGH